MLVDHLPCNKLSSLFGKVILQSHKLIQTPQISSALRLQFQKYCVVKFTVQYSPVAGPTDKVGKSTLIEREPYSRNSNLADLKTVSFIF